MTKKKDDKAVTKKKDDKETKPKMDGVTYFSEEAGVPAWAAGLFRDETDVLAGDGTTPPRDIPQGPTEGGVLAWRLVRHAGGKLLSLNVQQEWLVGDWVKAECRAKSFSFAYIGHSELPGDAPHAEHDRGACGIHAYKTYEATRKALEIDSVLRRYGSIRIVPIILGGKIVPHRDGWRAELATLLCDFEINVEGAEHLARERKAMIWCEHAHKLLTWDEPVPPAPAPVRTTVGFPVPMRRRGTKTQWFCDKCGFEFNKSQTRCNSAVACKQRQRENNFYGRNMDDARRYYALRGSARRKR